MFLTKVLLRLQEVKEVDYQKYVVDSSTIKRYLHNNKLLAHH